MTGIHVKYSLPPNQIGNIQDFCASRNLDPLQKLILIWFFMLQESNFYLFQCPVHKLYSRLLIETVQSVPS